jgi:hypothetical protein
MEKVMSDITRLSLTTIEPSGLPDVIADKNGNYVFYSEHRRLIKDLEAQLSDVDYKWHERFREQANHWHERTAMLRNQLDHLTEMVATQSALAPRTYIINKKHKPEALQESDDE